MNARRFRSIGLALAILFIFSTAAFPRDLKPIQLLAPDTAGGKPLMQALKDRQSSREFTSETLSLRHLSNMLWAACGVNRPDSAKRTAPSAMNKQEIDVYVAMAQGLYLYDPKTHTLQPILAGDIREKTGGQAFVKQAAVNLIYVADYAKMGGGPDESKILYSAADTGFIAQNVYLYCASEGLATVVRGMVDKPALSAAMKLRPDQKIILTQSVGHPNNQPAAQKPQPPAGTEARGPKKENQN